MKRIAIIGASARAAAMSALRAGLRVVAADLFADVDLVATCPVMQVKEYPQGCAEWLFDQKIDYWIYAGALENYPEVVDKLAGMAPLLGVSGKVLQQVRNPHWLAKQCHAERFLFPPLVSCDGFIESGEFPDKNQWLAKTYQHSSGKGTWALDEPADWERAHNAQAVAQLRINGTSRAAIFALTNHEAHFYGMSEQLVGSDEFGIAKCARASSWQYAGSLAMEDPLPHHHALQRIGNWLHKAGLRGIVGVDLIDDGQKLWVIEVNPR